MGIAVLLAICINPYASFYDALLLTIPAVLWWHSRERYPPAARWLIAGLISGMWIGEQYTLYYVESLKNLGIMASRPFSIVAPCFVLWLLVEAYALFRETKTGSDLCSRG